MDLRTKDLNLLVVFASIWEQRSLSKAAEKLHIGQSAVSHALGRLRLEQEDPLFVRSSKGVTPTDKAKALAPRIQKALSDLEALYFSRERFDPKKETRELKIATGDYFSITMLEGFVAKLSRQAPKVRLQIRPVANVFTPSTFESGEVDLAITAIDIGIKEGFHSQILNKDGISFCLRKNHPALKGSNSPESYLELQHINVSNYGDPVGVVDEILSKVKKKREVSMVASSFFDAAKIVRSSDLSFSGPRAICEGLAKEYGLEALALPFRHEARPVRMIWHDRTEEDPFHRWTRAMVGGTESRGR